MKTIVLDSKDINKPFDEIKKDILKQLKEKKDE